MSFLARRYSINCGEIMNHSFKKQNWNKLGCIYNRHKYSAVPVGFFVEKDTLRIFLTSRDEHNRSTPFSIDLNMRSLEVNNIREISVNFGEIGTFDENGIMPTSLVEVESNLFLYYIGWNKGSSTPFRNSIGLLISKDNGKTFIKYSQGPILDRGIHDECFVASNCIFKEQEFYRMYYLSCGKWVKIDESTYQHYYNIKYAESTDGINWSREGLVAIDFLYPNEYAISVPRVVRDDIYKMWYSYRGGPNADTYRIGYAESDDGLEWNRKDLSVGLDVSKSGWDEDMICYPFIFDYMGSRYMLYNGNGYGKSGVGLAVLAHV